MKYKKQLLDLAREIICNKKWTPQCQIKRSLPTKSNNVDETYGCVIDKVDSNRTCLLCCVTEARNKIQDDKSPSERKVWEIPLYYEIYPFLWETSKKKIGKHHKNLTSSEALVVLEELEASSIDF